MTTRERVKVDPNEIILYTNPRHGRERESVEPDYNAWQEQKISVKPPDGRGAVMLERAMHKLVQRGSSKMQIHEALINAPDAANDLRDAVRYIAFEAYTNMRTYYEAVTKPMPSSKQSEYYWRGGAFGRLNKTPSGQTAPNINKKSEGRAYIRNERYANIVEITGDNLRFSEVGIYDDIAEELGQAAKSTIDSVVFEVITDTSNYTRSAANDDNDVGANYQTLPFSLKNYNTAYSVVATMRDRTSRQPGYCFPDTIITTPLGAPYIQQALMSPIRRVGGGSNEVFGTGTGNPFAGAIKNIIVTPFLGTTYQWALFDSMKNKLYYQEVEPYSVYGEPQSAASTAWFEREVIRFMVNLYFGVGFADDRAWFYSDNTAEHVVA